MAWYAGRGVCAGAGVSRPSVQPSLMLQNSVAHTPSPIAVPSMSAVHRPAGSVPGDASSVLFSGEPS